MVEAPEECLKHRRGAGRTSPMAQFILDAPERCFSFVHTHTHSGWLSEASLILLIVPLTEAFLQDSAWLYRE